MEQFVETLEKNLEEAVEGLTPMKVLCTVLVRGCFFLHPRDSTTNTMYGQNTIHLRLISLTRIWLRTLTHVNFNHTSIIETRYKVLRLNVKLSEV